MSKKNSRLAVRRHQQGSSSPNSRQLSRFRAELLRWFENHGRKFPWRKATASKYELIIAEVLLQRTRAETVATFFPRFVREFPSWKKLGTASIAQLEDYLRPIGLWRRRAISIQALAREMVKGNGRFPTERADIEALPGVGQYIANAVLLFCHGIPQPLLDANMARVLERVFGPRKLADIRYDPYLQELAKKVVDREDAARINWAILDLAATICLPKKPRCNECPLVSLSNHVSSCGNEVRNSYGPVVAGGTRHFAWPSDVDAGRPEPKLFKCRPNANRWSSV